MQYFEFPYEGFDDIKVTLDIKKGKVELFVATVDRRDETRTLSKGYLLQKRKLSGP